MLAPHAVHFNRTAAYMCPDNYGRITENNRDKGKLNRNIREQHIRTY
jgi:hypothetical protein